MANYRRTGWRIVGGSLALLAILACTTTPEEAGISAPTSTTQAVPDTPGPTSTLPTTTTSPTTQPSPVTIPPLEQADLYVPAENEVLRDRKQLGGQFAQAVLTYAAGTTPEQHAATLTASFGREFTLEEIDELREAMHPGSDSVGTVHYVQIGGNRPQRASLMVWVNAEMQSATGERTTESRILDVRVRVEGADLIVEELASAGGPSATEPEELTELAASVLDHPGITMPDSARWDIYAGHTTDEMLNRMLEVAELSTYSVLVLNRGHPYFVFDTDSVSRHTVGQAMDVYEVDGELVVDSRFEGSPAWTLSSELFSSGIRSIGSPWAFDGFGGRSFTDDVHQDHLHITGY